MNFIKYKYKFKLFGENEKIEYIGIGTVIVEDKIKDTIDNIINNKIKEDEKTKGYNAKYEIIQEKPIKIYISKKNEKYELLGKSLLLIGGLIIIKKIFWE